MDQKYVALAISIFFGSAIGVALEGRKKGKPILETISAKKSYLLITTVCTLAAIFILETIFKSF